ncbi:MAG: Rpn family recombination-promoting nuclease/putative transposase [Polyangiales bacterium]
MPYADLKNDFVFRRVFGHHPAVLCGLLNDFLGRPPERAIVAVEYLPPDQVPELPGVKLSIVDVKCRDASGATFVVEMQVLPVTGFLNRVVFNACKAYVGTLQRGDGYDKLTPVVAVTVCDFELWSDGERDAQRLPRVPLVSRWAMAEQGTGAPGIPQVEYVFCELPKLRDRAPANALERWVGLFVAAPVLDAATVAREPFTEAQRMALELANEATFTEAELDAYRKARDEVQQMIQYGKDGEVRGEAKGRRDSLLRVLARRGLAPTDEERARIEACRDVATLERWLDRAVDAPAVRDVIA